MVKPLILMYSGQGSQYYQMGKMLFENNQTFKKWMLKADQLCHDWMGTSILEPLYHENAHRSQPFTRTLLTHPAIFMVEYALTQVFFECGLYPDGVLGTSMGEIAASVTAGVLDFETALHWVIIQAQVLEQYGRVGGMLTILENPALYQTLPDLYEHSTLAAINFSSHFVISGNLDVIKKIAAGLKEKNIVSSLLPVSHGFHSALIDPAKLPFLHAINALDPLNPPRIPFFSCVYAQSMTKLTPDYFWEIVRSPIQFKKMIDWIESEGGAIYVDCGPSGTLATLVKYNLSSDSHSKILPILMVDGQDLKRLEYAIHDLHHDYQA